MRKKEITLPTILGLLLTVGGLISGILLLQGQVRQSAQAAVGEEPREIKISNVDDLGFVVSWTTEKAVSGFIQYSENGGTDSVVSDERDQLKGSIDSYFTHFVTVKGLKPDTTYTFKIGSGKNLYDGQGNEYAVKTGPTLIDTPAADVAYGSVMTPSQEPAEGAIVYIEMPGVSTQAALVKSSGAWVIPLSTARSTDLTSYAQYDKQTTKYDLTVKDGLMGSAAVVLTTGSSNPVPEITLGQNLDLTTQKQTEKTQITPKSRFLAETLAPASESGQLVVLTPNNGEKVNSNKPVVIGQAPAGTEITVEIHSETAIVNKIQAGSDGQFTYNVPQDLAPGEHTVTISAMINGTLKSITRSFTVYAAGESSIPFYSASPSATISPSAATPTSKPGPSATPTPTLRPTPTTKVTPTRATTPTATPLPTVTTTLYPTPTPITSLVQSGNETPTLMLMVAGMGMIFAGGWWYKKAS